MALKVRHAREVKEDSAEDVAALTHAMHEHRAAREDAETKLAHERQVGPELQCKAITMSSALLRCDPYCGATLAAAWRFTGAHVK